MLIVVITVLLMVTVLNAVARAAFITPKQALEMVQGR